MKIRIIAELPERYFLTEEGVTMENLKEQLEEMKDDIEKELGQIIVLKVERVED